MKRLRLILALCLPFLLAACSLPEPEERKQGAQSDNVVMIAILQSSSHESLDDIREWIYDELHQVGYWNRGETVIRYENFQDSQTTADQILDELKDEPVDCYITLGTLASTRTKEKIRQTPIIFAAVSDPVTIGLISSPTAPGGNISGTCDYVNPEKEAQLMVEMMPDMKRLGVLYSDSQEGNVQEIQTLKTALKKQGIDLEEYFSLDPSGLESGIEKLAKNCDAIYSPSNNMIAAGNQRYANKALEMELPYFAGGSSMVRQGCLASICGDYEQLARDSARMAIRSLHGENPGSMPLVYFENTDEITVNQQVFDQLDGLESVHLVMPKSDNLAIVNSD